MKEQNNLEMDFEWKLLIFLDYIKPKFDEKETNRIPLRPLLYFLITFFFKPEGLNDASNAVLAVSAWIAIWWITEAIAIEATALLFPLTGASSLTETGAAFWTQVYPFIHRWFHTSDCNKKKQST